MTKVFTFGAKPPSDDALVDREMQAAHRYYNAMIEIERAALARKAELRRLHLPGMDAAEAEIAAAQQAIERLLAEIAAAKSAAKRSRRTAEESASLKVCREQLAAARLVKKSLLARLNAGYLAAIEANNETLYADRRRAYGEAGCGWGTRLRIAQAVELAMKIDNPLTGKKMARTPESPPHFRKWRGDGILAVQIQNGMTVQDLIGCQDTRLRMEILPGRRGKHRARDVVFSLRVGTSETREPVWVTVRGYMHRELPADARVMWAVLTRKQVAVRRHRDPSNPLGVWKPYYEWEVQLTARTGHVNREPAAAGICGVDLGWRLMADGSLRVAYVVGDDGHEEDVRIDPTAWTHAHDLQAIKDGRFNDARELLRKFIANRRPEDTLEWLREATATMAQWKSPGRLATVVSQWQRFDGDEGIYEILKLWVVKDAHLWQYKRGQEIKAASHRLTLYRRLAARLARRYRVIGVEDADWRKLNRSAQDGPENETARRHMRMAAVGLLRQCVVQSGAVVQMVETPHTTNECHACGHVNTFDADQRLQLTLACAGCGEAWDQDRNAAIVVMARAKMMGEEPGTARKPEGNGETGDAPVNGAVGNRWAKRKASRSQRLAQMDAGTHDAASAVASPEHGG